MIARRRLANEMIRCSYLKTDISKRGLCEIHTHNTHTKEITMSKVSIDTRAGFAKALYQKAASYFKAVNALDRLNRQAEIIKDEPELVAMVSDAKARTITDRDSVVGSIISLYEKRITENPNAFGAFIEAMLDEYKNDLSDDAIKSLKNDPFVGGMLA